MKQRFGFSQFLFIVPLLIFIAIFSLWPIARSFSYTFFDYRLNDQQKSGFYLSERFNANLFSENCSYLIYFLNDDKTVVSEDLQVEFDRFIAEISEIHEKYGKYEGVIEISGEQKDEILRFLSNAAATKADLYGRAGDVQFYNAEGMDLILEDMQTVIIEPNFIGLDGYAALLKDARAMQALRQTIVFTVFSVAIELVLGMALALIMNMAVKGIGLIRTAGIIPWAIPTAVSALMWSYLYDGSAGIFAYFAAGIGLIDSPESMLLTSGGAMASAIFADVWKTAPYMALLLLAGLQTIDATIYESASIDGSGRATTFFRITLPLIKSSVLVALLFRTLDAFRVFDLIYVLTGGGPGGSTETLSIYAYKLMFAQSNFGYGSIVVIFMFVCVATIAGIFVKTMGAGALARS